MDTGSAGRSPPAISSIATAALQLAPMAPMVELGLLGLLCSTRGGGGVGGGRWIYSRLRVVVAMKCQAGERVKYLRREAQSQVHVPPSSCKPRNRHLARPSLSGTSMPAASFAALHVSGTSFFTRRGLDRRVAAEDEPLAAMTRMGRSIRPRSFCLPGLRWVS